jgi:hypothetical protein
MAKKQTRRSISVSRTTYERLKAFCETQGISMSQFVETRVGDFLSGEPEVELTPIAPRPTAPPRPVTASSVGSAPRPAAQPPLRSEPTRPSPMTSAAARYAVEPPPPIIKPREPVDAPAPAAPTADQIFTF